jgi:two-component system CheB/CheR fusion protein
MNAELQVELWNDVAVDMWGLRQDEVKGRPFLGLDIGLPVERLREPLFRLLESPDRPAELTVNGTNRRGRSMAVRVFCAAAGQLHDHGRGVILLMQEIPPPMGMAERTH